MKEFIEKLIGRLEEQAEQYRNRGFEHEKHGYSAMADKYYAKQCSYSHSIEIVNELAEEYRQDLDKNSQGWISVSDKLPEEPFGCLVTVMDCEPMTQTDFENILPYHVGYDGETWNDADGNVVPFEVIAWMPLPAPFEEGE